MNDNEAPIEDREASIRLAVESIISDRTDQMFEDFDRLHRRNIHDDDVVKALRSLRHSDLLDAYAEWADIDLREDDNTTMNPAVPDPGDAPSYSGLVACTVDESGGLDEALGTQRGDRESWPATPGELTAELTAAGINADNLEQGLIDAYNENRINSGIFYAERSSDGVHWHVYKKRSHEDNGAYIATANSRDGAQFILNSLGTGITNYTERGDRSE